MSECVAPKLELPEGFTTSEDSELLDLRYGGQLVAVFIASRADPEKIRKTAEEFLSRHP